MIVRPLARSSLPLLCAAALACGGGASRTVRVAEAAGVVLEEAWIPMPDGVRLAADLYRPAGAGSLERLPVLLEYLPYRKHESRGDRFRLYSYFVRHGYVVARVDIRGTGASEGTLVPYEYSEQEQRDGEAVIDWLARRPWSLGKVGMFGVSWGGFNSIHLAMRNPPALGAIVAIDASDDLFQDDVHYIDGILHVDSYEIGQDVRNAVPAAPGFRLDERFFSQRFDTEPWLLVYKQQQRDGPFWDRASLDQRYEQIRVPTFVIGGWYDGYRDSVPRMLERLQAPKKAMVGPWGHSFPNECYPEPCVEWREQAVRWFDQFLRGRETGILAEPAFAVFVRDWHPPGSELRRVPGAWRTEEGWPIVRVSDRTLALRADHSLGESEKTSRVHTLDYQASAGVEASGSVNWWGDATPDQRPTDALSLVYDSAPLTELFEILGFPRVVLNAAAAAPLAHWVVRLSDVAPDGQVTQVTGAAQNGAHLRSAAEPRPLRPGEEVSFTVELHFTSWRFAPGHRVRVSIANAQWPMLWPTPHAMSTSLRLGGDAPSRLVLPAVAAAERPAPAFADPAVDPVLPGWETVEGGTVSGYAEVDHIERDPASGSATVVSSNQTQSRHPWGVETVSERITHRTNDREPHHSSVLGEHTIEWQLVGRTLRFAGVLDLRSDRDTLHFLYTRRVWENGALVRERSWRRAITRDGQ